MSDCEDEIDVEQLAVDSGSCTDPNSWGFGSYAAAMLVVILFLFALKKVRSSRSITKTKES